MSYIDMFNCLEIYKYKKGSTILILESNLCIKNEQVDFAEFLKLVSKLI